MESVNYTTIPTDEETVDRIIKGEKHLYAGLMRKFNLQLYRISMSIIKDEMEAEDIMQTSYLNAYLQLDSFQNKSSFSTWLTRILINESLLQKKRRIKGKQVLLEKAEKDFHDDTPLNKLMREELKGILEKAVSKLPEKYRLVFVMREVQEMSIHETMEALCLGESNVKIRLNRAKKMLRKELNRYYEPSQIFEFHLVRCNRIVNSVMNKINEMGKVDISQELIT